MEAGKSGWGRAGPSSGLLGVVHGTDYLQGHSTVAWVEQTQAACRHHLATWSKASLLPLVAMAMPAQGSPSGPEMLGLISLSAAESASGRLSQPLGLCNLRGQGGGRASGLGTHDVCMEYHQAPIVFFWSYAQYQEPRDRKEQTCHSASNSGKMSVLVVLVGTSWSKWG